MNDDRLQDLFERVTELAPGERTQFLVGACGGDVSLEEELRALLAADAVAVDEGFWQRSALHNEVIGDDPTRAGVGQIIGNYRLVELIGRGGMGAVYRAVRVDAEFDKCVAIKLIDAIFHSSEMIAQFRAERQILANLDHPNIARLLDGGARADGLPYLIMEYVEGVSPYDYCREHNLSTAQRLMLFQQICSAVHSAHQNMVIHRDLKPANILVTADGTPKLLDFGIAKVLNPDVSRGDEALTAPGMLKLTARYASPEQVRGESLTTASDIYSLGVILYELLAEHSPYGDTDRPTHQIMHAVCEEEPAKPSVWAGKLKGDLDNIVLRALKKAPLERYSSAAQFSEDILRYLEGRPVQARGDAPLYLAAKFVRRNRVVVAVAGLLLCSLVGGLIEVTLARAKAERRFNEVRQLAHSVMFDYADAIDRLPGATPVRAQLVKDALTYLDNLSKEADTPQLQQEIVNAYVRVSNVQGNEYENNLGDTAASLESARKAVGAAEKLLKEDKATSALDSAANAFSTYGSVLYSAGNLTSADGAYQRAIGLRRQLAAQSPGDFSNKIALANCLREMGDLHGGYGFQSMGKTSEAQAFYEQAKVLSDEMSAQQPANVDVAKESYETLMSLSASENATGKHDDAARDLDAALTQIRKVEAAEPGDTNVKMELANGESRFGQMLLDKRDANAAVQQFADSSDLLSKLLDKDPGNAIYRRGQSVVEAQWAAALRVAGQVSASVVHNENALRMAEDLRHDSPNSAQYKTDVGISERKLSEGLVAAGDAASGLHYAERARAILCENDKDSTNPNGLANCDRALLAAGNAYRVLHDPKAAITVLRRAVEIASARSEADAGNTIFRSDLARAQAGLAGALAEAGDAQGARGMYDEASKTWGVLRQTKSISGEDAHRSDVAAQALAELQARR